MRSFGLDDPAGNKKRIQKALEHALDIRKFEIGLYWQRAAYFWALIAATFAGYFAILGAEHLADKEYLAYIVGCIGLVFSWAWFLVNRGSKYWQENWENHVDMLEDAVTGPLYKTVLDRGEQEGVDKWLIGPLPRSVSRVNQWVSCFTLAIWLCLIGHALPTFQPDGWLIVKYVPVGGITIIAGACMFKSGATYRGDYAHVMWRRKSTIVGERST